MNMARFAVVAAAGLFSFSAQAAMVQNINFEGKGVVSDHSLNIYCDDDQPECFEFTPESLGYPPLGTAFTLSGTINFAQPVSDTGDYYYLGWDEETSFTGSLSLTIAGYPYVGWHHGWFSDGLGDPWLRLENGRPVGFDNIVEGCAGMEGLFARDGRISFDWRDCGWEYDYNFVLGAVGSITRVWVDGRELGVPEPATWAMLIAGFGLVGTAARRRRVLQKS